MALTDDNSLVMPVAPMYGGNNGGGFGSGFGGDWGWIILLLLIAGNGWGNGFGGGMGGFAADGAALYPWMNQAEITTGGFQNAATNQAISSLQNSVTSGFGDLQTALCSGFAGVANGFAQAEIGANARQMASMNQLFGLSSQFADCCCENRVANCQTQNTIQNEGNMTRFADLNNTRDIIQSQTSSTQAILDKLCQLELDAKQDKINDLERQLTMANFSASQVAQTARLEQSNSEVIDGLYNRLATCPVGTMPVYGNQPIFTCPQQNNGCGCGNNF